MEAVLFLSISLFGYVVPLLWTYNWIKMAHGPGGKYYMLTMTKFDWFFILTPFINFNVMICTLFESPYEKH